MLWFFLIFSTLCWGMAEIFYKLGNVASEKYAHLKTTAFVGIFFGIYSIIILLTQDVSIRDLPANFLRYLPVAACYIVSMTCSYFGVRFIEESISDPIENTSCAFVPLLCALFMHETFNRGTFAAIVLVFFGIIGVGLFDQEGKALREKKFGKKLAVISIAMPFCYMLLDTMGTFLDIYYTDNAENSVLVGVTENNLEHTANCCYELTFFLVAIGIIIFLKSRHVSLFDIGTEDISTVDEPALCKQLTSEQLISKQALIEQDIPKHTIYNHVYTEHAQKRIDIFGKIHSQRYKIIAALFETGGQATYLFALSEGTGIAAVILGSGTVIFSFILSRIVLKEKLTVLQYVFIGIIFVGIITLSIVS